MATVLRMARACHEANRALCEAFGDHSQLPWDEAPEWQRKSCVNGVRFALANPDAPANAQHDNWMAEKIAAGWKHGSRKSEKAKTHPCLVPFDELPAKQQAKDHVFRAIVAAMSDPRPD